jgi:hypothetical protein
VRPARCEDIGARFLAETAMPTMTEEQAKGSNAEDGFLILNGEIDNPQTDIVSENLEDISAKTAEEALKVLNERNFRFDDVKLEEHTFDDPHTNDKHTTKVWVPQT